MSEPTDKTEAKMKSYIVKIFWKRIIARAEGEQSDNGIEAVLNEAYERGYRVYDTVASAGTEWREATRREECLLLIALEWSMAGVDIPPEALARAAAAYDEAVKPVPAPLLDRAA